MTLQSALKTTDMQTVPPLEQSRQLPGLDVLKFAMAIAVVALHSQLFKSLPWLNSLVYPLFESAVPTFFVISAYLFFAKWNHCRTPAEEWSLLGHYLKRLGVFYLFWFVVMLPVTVVVRKWLHHFDAGVFFRALFLDSTFRGSYFVMSLLLGVPLVCLVKKVIFPLAMLFVGLALYVPFQPPLQAMMPRLAAVGGYSFVPGLLWIAIGAVAASSAPHRHGKADWLVLLLLYAAMCTPVLSFAKPILRAAFVATLVAAFLHIRPRNAALCLWLRKLSILIFVTHFPFNSALVFLGKSRFPVLADGWLHFILILSAALLCSLVILRLKDKSFFGWLKWGL